MKKYRGAFIKNEREIGCLAEANRMVANILDAVGDIVKPGITTSQIEDIAQNMCKEYGVKPALKVITVIHLPHAALSTNR